MSEHYLGKNQQISVGTKQGCRALDFIINLNLVKELFNANGFLKKNGKLNALLENRHVI